jgi:hypothetical protein
MEVANSPLFKQQWPPLSIGVIKGLSLGFLTGESVNVREKIIIHSGTRVKQRSSFLVLLYLLLWTFDCLSFELFDCLGSLVVFYLFVGRGPT